MATKLHYFGDVEIASRYKATAEILLSVLHHCQPAPSSLSRRFPDGTRIYVQRVTEDMDTIDIYAGITTKKDKYKWTLVYAPCPRPDPQDWPGWFECDISDLIADGPIEFLLLPWGDAVYGDFTTADSVTPVTTNPDDSVVDGGWWSSGWAYSSVYPLYLGPCIFSIGIERIAATRVGSTCSYTFPLNLVPAIILENYNISGGKHWTGGGWSLEPDGFPWIPSNAYGVIPPPPLRPNHTLGPYDPGYTIVHTEGLISWSSVYMIGFWKWELINYTPASYLDDDNYAMFYEYYESESYSSTAFLTDRYVGITTDLHTTLVSGGWWTDEMDAEYLALLGDNTDHVTFSYTVVNYVSGGMNVNIHDPDSVGGTANRASINYETHFCGKYEGVYFDDIIGTATWTGTVSIPTGWVGSWSGDNIFAWMARFYDKGVLLSGDEGQEAPSDHHLLIASWLRGAPAGNVSDTLKVPGLASTGIDTVTYIARHGTTYTTKQYSASHPGWHDVYTANGRTWRAYGDLFAALKKIITL